MADHGSRLARLRLGQELRKIRDSTGLTQEQAADLVDNISRRKLVSIENGDQRVNDGDVLALCHNYGRIRGKPIPPDVTDALLVLAAGTRQTSGEWAAAALPDWFGLYVELEREAKERETWQPGLVHGLLQTPAYARAVIEAAAEEGLSEETIERRGRLRQDRQAHALERGRITAIMGAAALAREVGSRRVMEEQRKHLIALARRENVTIKIIPFEAGAHVAMQDAFTIFSFDGQFPDVTYVQTLHGASYLEKRDHMELYRGTFAKLHEIARPIEEELNAV